MIAFATGIGVGVTRGYAARMLPTEGVLAMALPSQVARGGGSGRVYTSKKLPRLTPLAIAIGIAVLVVVIALAAWGFGALGRSGDPTANEPIDTSVKSEPVAEERSTRLSTGTASQGISSLSRPIQNQTQASNAAPVSPLTQQATQQASQQVTEPQSLIGRQPMPGPLATQSPGSSEPEPLTIHQGGVDGSGGALSRALDHAGGPGTDSGVQTPADPDVVTTLGLLTPQQPGTPAGTGAPAGSAGVPLATPPADAGTSDAQGATATAIRAADEKIRAGDLVVARKILSQALLSASTSEQDKQGLRGRLEAINKDLVFSPKVYAGDPFVETYTVQSGDSLARISNRRQLATDWRLIQRVNGLSNPNRINVGQKLKLVRGPFHAVVTKSAYRLDLYMGSPDEPSDWVFIRSFAVGLGEDNGTPNGTFVVKKNSKLVNPYWVNPRTGEKFDADDPKNPIGEHWIGIEGIGESAPYTGYGLHGTIEPESIGRQRSMGCVRMHSPDIEMMYELLVESVSVVKIQP
jgi:LysM repeat protein